MSRYVAFLRGVSPQNAKSADLTRTFETAGFANEETLLSRGNVAFDASSIFETANPSPTPTGAPKPRQPVVPNVMQLSIGNAPEANAEARGRVTSTIVVHS